MTKRDFLKLIMVGLPSAALLGCSDLFPARYRFRMTVEVDTPQGMRTGSSVMEVSSRTQNIPGKGGPTPQFDLTGEAVAVDLPGGRTLFALVVEGLASYVTTAFEPDFDSKPHPDGYAGQLVAAVRRLGGRDQRDRNVVLSHPSRVIQFVTFRDNADPGSVMSVDPTDLAAAFGPGVALLRLTVTITDDAITSEIGRRFVWWDEYRSKRLRLNGKTGAISTNELSDNLGTGVFKQDD